MAKDLLVGSTGFVGGNLAAKHAFAAVCHSTDIAAQFGAKPDLCVYAGVPAAMFLANADPDADLAVMAAARENLRQIAPKQLVLISSIAVYADSRGKDEQSPMTPDGLPAYGRNRLQLERWVREDYPNALIVRLPALYGIGLKKNFLFDLHTITPAMLKPEKYTELAQKSPLVRDGYTLADNGFYKLNGAVDAAALREFFAGNDFNALAFTDSRSRYQFYHLARLWQDVQTALQACHNIKSVRQRLTVLENLGLGYLTLGEETPSLSGGEAQRLKLAGEMGKGQSDTVFIFDEPTIGLHPLDVRTLLKVFQTLIESGATVIVIEHDLDVIRSADYIIDMGPGGGEAGGIIVATGTPEQVAANKNSITGKYLCKYLSE